jgi:hypothetical protein
MRTITMDHDDRPAPVFGCLLLAAGLLGTALLLLLMI